MNQGCLSFETIEAHTASMIERGKRAAAVKQQQIVAECVSRRARYPARHSAKLCCHSCTRPTMSNMIRGITPTADHGNSTAVASGGGHPRSAEVISTSDDMVKLKRVPRMMAVVGGGIICIENACI